MTENCLRKPPRRGRPGYDLESLLEIAVDVFTRQGYDSTTMEDLAAHLGISKSAIYHHVTGKAQLLEIAVDRALDGLEATVQHTRDLGGVAAIDRLEHLMRASVRVLLEQKPFVTLLLRVLGNTEVEQRALERRRAFDRYVAELVKQAVVDGAVRPDLDPDLTARLLFGMVNSLAGWVRPLDLRDVETLTDALCVVAFDGLRVTRRPRTTPSARVVGH